MVLNDLAEKISKTFRVLSTATVIDDELLATIVKETCRALIESDVNMMLIKRLKDNINQRVNLEEIASGLNKRKVIQKVLFEELCNLVDPDGGAGVSKKRGAEAEPPWKPVRKQTNVVMFVGLQGSGKTTTVTKMAHYYAKKGWKVALVCADTFRAGAFDQLKQNATKIKVPFYGSYTEVDPAIVAEQGVEAFRRDKYEIIIVDTSGRHKQQAELFEEMVAVKKAVSPDFTVFVLDASIGQAAGDQAAAFKQSVDLGGVIVTKLDGHAKGGGALSAVAATGAPIVFLGTGEHFDAFEPFATRPFIQRLLGMGDIEGLVEMVEDMGLDKAKQEELNSKIQSGGFSLRDLYELYKNMLDMGPISKVLSMMPGMSSLASSAGDEMSAARIKRTLVVMDSMTDQELDSNGQIFVKPKEQGRLIRVARGSGVHPAEVMQVVQQSKKMADLVKTMGGMKGLWKNGDLSRNVNANQMQQLRMQLAKTMDPAVLQQMGGMAGLDKMIKQLHASGAGMPGM